MLLDALLAGARPCAGCRGGGGPWCASCAATVPGPVRAVRRAALDLPVHAAGDYAGPLREAVVAFKDHGRWSLRAPLGHLLARAVAASLLANGSERVVLVPVPSARDAVRLRDGDHVGELADRAARLLSGLGAAACVAPVLVAARRRADQVGLGRAGRAANVAGTLRARPAAAGLDDVVLVDDLVTTGATLAEAVRALSVAGARVLGAAVVAAVPDRPSATPSTVPRNRR